MDFTRFSRDNLNKKNFGAIMCLFDRFVVALKQRNDKSKTRQKQKDKKKKKKKKKKLRQTSLGKILKQ